jgi:hypothetical protein
VLFCTCNSKKSFNYSTLFINNPYDHNHLLLTEISLDSSIKIENKSSSNSLKIKRIIFAAATLIISPVSASILSGYVIKFNCWILYRVREPCINFKKLPIPLRNKIELKIKQTISTLPPRKRQFYTLNLLVTVQNSQDHCFCQETTIQEEEKLL